MILSWRTQLLLQHPRTGTATTGGGAHAARTACSTFFWASSKWRNKSMASPPYFVYVRRYSWIILIGHHVQCRRIFLWWFCCEDTSCRIYYAECHDPILAIPLAACNDGMFRMLYHHYWLIYDNNYGGPILHNHHMLECVDPSQMMLVVRMIWRAIGTVFTYSTQYRLCSEIIDSDILRSIPATTHHGQKANNQGKGFKVSIYYTL